MLEGRGPALVDLVALNAAAALVVADVVEDLGDGVALAREALRDGSARDVRDRWVARSRQAAAEEAASAAVG